MKNSLKKENYLIAFLIILSIIVRVVYVFGFTEPEKYTSSDMGFYDIYAEMLLEDKDLFGPTYWAPFYYIFLSGLYFIFRVFGVYEYKYFLVPAVSILMNSGALYFIFQITKKLANKKSAFLAGLLYAFYYPLIYFHSWILSENLFIPIFLWVFYLIICKLDYFSSEPENPKSVDVRILKKRFFLLGILLGIALITRPICALFIPFLVLWYVYYSTYNRQLTTNKNGQLKTDNKRQITRNTCRRLGVISYLLLGIALMVGFQIYFNYMHTNGRVKSISSSGGVNFAMAWCDVKSLSYQIPGRSWGFGPPANVYYPQSRRMFTNVDFFDQGYYYQLGWQCIKNRPIQLLDNLKNIGRLFQSAFFPRSYESLKYSKELIFVFKLITYFALIPLSFFAIPKIVPENRKYVYLFGGLLLSLFVMVYLQNPGEERYLVPYNFVFLILGAVGILRLTEKVKNKK